MCESLKASLAVVVTNAGISNSSEGHGFDKQMDVHLIDPATAEGQTREEVIDRFLVAAE
jgi:predicted GNAT family acetyltransferase